MDKPKPDTTVSGLHAFLIVLRKAGVKRFSGMLDSDRVEIELYPTPSPPAPPLKKEDIEAVENALKEAGAGLCACGHDFLEHNETGHCYRGCPTATCAKEVKTSTQE